MEVIHSTKAGLEKAAHGHQHQTDRAVAAGKSAQAAREAFANHVRIHGIEDDYGIVAHAQRRGGVNPVSLPAAFAEGRVDFSGVFAALATDESIAGRKSLQAFRVFEGRAASLARSCSADIGRREKHRLNTREVAFLSHPLQENASDHSSPSDESDAQHAFSEHPGFRQPVTIL